MMLNSLASFHFRFSCGMRLNLDYLLVRVWECLSLIRVYTKRRGGEQCFVLHFHATLPCAPGQLSSVVTAVMGPQLDALIPFVPASIVLELL